MSTAYWCILVAALLPYAWIVIAKRGGTRYNNRDPRVWLAKQDAPLVQRANAAHLNAFEAFAPFAASVLMAQLAGVPASLVSLLALLFVGFRVLHGICYLAAWHWLRSLAWLGGYACVLWLMVRAALAIGHGLPA
jgi:uncharacterized MAPEG superfamily protein